MVRSQQNNMLAQRYIAELQAEGIYLRNLYTPGLPIQPYRLKAVDGQPQQQQQPMFVPQQQMAIGSAPPMGQM